MSELIQNLQMYFSFSFVQYAFIAGIMIALSSSLLGVTLVLKRFSYIRFPIMDFYLKVCDRFPIYGVVPQGLRMIDVGKLNSLDQAECLLRELRRSCPSG